MSAQDLKYSSSTIQADLDRFQRQKVADIREMCLAMARSHRDWCKKVKQRVNFNFTSNNCAFGIRTLKLGKKQRRISRSFLTTPTVFLTLRHHLKTRPVHLIPLRRQLYPLGEPDGLLFTFSKKQSSITRIQNVSRTIYAQDQCSQLRGTSLISLLAAFSVHFIIRFRSLLFRHPRRQYISFEILEGLLSLRLPACSCVLLGCLQ